MEAAAALSRTEERESERNPEPQAVNYLVQAGRGQGQEQPAAGLLPACCPSACPAVPCSGKGS